MAFNIGSLEVGLLTVIIATIVAIFVLYKVYFMLKERMKSIVLLLVFLIGLYFVVKWILPSII